MFLLPTTGRPTPGSHYKLKLVYLKKQQQHNNLKIQTQLIVEILNG